MTRTRPVVYLSSFVLLAAVLTACATPEPSPGLEPIVACGPLSEIVWSNLSRSDPILTDVQVLTANLDVDDPLGEVGWTREQPLAGFPLQTTPTASTKGSAGLLSLIRSLSDRQVFIIADEAVFRAPIASISVPHGGRWIAYASGSEITAEYTATCVDNGRPVHGTFHGWSGPVASGSVECALSDEMPFETLGQSVRDYCLETA